jgi:hypothetical protein
MVSSTVEIQELYGNELAVIGMDADEDPEVVRTFTAEHGMAYLNLIADEATLRTYRVLGHPFTVLITPEGNVFSTYVGYMTAEVLDAKIQALLQETD